MCFFTLEKSLAPRVLACKHSKGHFVHHCCHCYIFFYLQPVPPHAIPPRYGPPPPPGTRCGMVAI